MTVDPHVVHLVPALFGPDGVTGGAERYALELAKAMSARVPTSLVTFGAADRTERMGALTVSVLGRPWRVRGQEHNPMSARLVPALLRGTVVHCHQQHVLASSVAAVTCRLSGRRVFVSDLGGGGWDVSSYVSTDAWYHGHLHISQYSRRIAGHALDPRAHVIYGGVDTHRFTPAATEGGDTVLFVGRLLPHKGVDDLIAALPDDLRLRLIGKPYDERYLADLHRLAQGKQVQFEHEVDDDMLIDAYRTALCVVLPSAYRTRYGGETRVPELLGQTPLEAMACGRPAIVTSVASLPEVVENGRTGFVIPPNAPAHLKAKLAWLRDHPVEAATMGRAGRARVSTFFTWDAVVDRCLEAYRS